MFRICKLGTAPCLARGWLLLFGILSLAACTKEAAPLKNGGSVQSAMIDETTHELTRDEPWYEHPAQARPQNGTLPAHTRVKILQDAGSYTKVRTAKGTVCFVASDALRPLRNLNP